MSPEEKLAAAKRWMGALPRSDFDQFLVLANDIRDSNHRQVVRLETILLNVEREKDSLSKQLDHYKARIKRAEEKLNEYFSYASILSEVVDALKGQNID